MGSCDKCDADQMRSYRCEDRAAPRTMHRVAKKLTEIPYTMFMDILIYMNIYNYLYIYIGKKYKHIKIYIPTKTTNSEVRLWWVPPSKEILTKTIIDSVSNFRGGFFPYMSLQNVSILATWLSGRELMVDLARGRLISLKASWAKMSIPTVSIDDAIKELSKINIWFFRRKLN